MNFLIDYGKKKLTKEVTKQLDTAKKMAVDTAANAAGDLVINKTMDMLKEGLNKLSKSDNIPNKVITLEIFKEKIIEVIDKIIEGIKPKTNNIKKVSTDQKKKINIDEETKKIINTIMTPFNLGLKNLSQVKGISNIIKLEKLEKLKNDFITVVDEIIKDNKSQEAPVPTEITENPSAPENAPAPTEITENASAPVTACKTPTETATKTPTKVTSDKVIVSEKSTNNKYNHNLIKNKYLKYKLKYLELKNNNL